MPAGREEILTEALRIKPNEVRWHFIADYYDGPISGLAFYGGRLLRFCCFPEDVPEHHVYVLQELTPEELREELRLKARFEALVGTHWSFDKEGNPLPRVLRSKELAYQYYNEERGARRPNPHDRQIVAWFDVEMQHESPNASGV